VSTKTWSLPLLKTPPTQSLWLPRNTWSAGKIRSQPGQTLSGYRVSHGPGWLVRTPPTVPRWVSLFCWSAGRLSCWRWDPGPRQLRVPPPHEGGKSRSDSRLKGLLPHHGRPLLGATPQPLCGHLSLTSASQVFEVILRFGVVDHLVTRTLDGFAPTCQLRGGIFFRSR
jgi:hypothetical protein